MEFYLKTMIQRLKRYDVDESVDTVGDLKRRVLDNEGIPIDQQCIIINGKEYDDTRTLASIRVELNEQRMEATGRPFTDPFKAILDFRVPDLSAGAGAASTEEEQQQSNQSGRP